MASDDGAHRPLICGSETPQPPFPVYLQGQVEHGFGRGSKQLNCPTANLPIASLDDPRAELGVEKTGVYFGFAQVAWHSETSVKDSEREVYPMVMSIGWNPHFKNTKKTVEVHILHDYPDDFYGQDMRVVVLGYIRPEKQYDSLDALINDIETDKRVGQASVQRPAYAAYLSDPIFTKVPRVYQ